MTATVRTKSAANLALADRTRRPRSASGSPHEPQFSFGLIERATRKDGGPEERQFIVVDDAVMVPNMRGRTAAPDRLVAALVILIQQADRNRRDGAGTLASSSELRTR